MTKTECIQKCRDTFRRYQKIQQDKMELRMKLQQENPMRDYSVAIEDCEQKVIRNKELADMCDNVLNQQAKSVEYYETENRQACEYLERLLVKKIGTNCPEWKPLSGDLIGLITQLDNMLTGIQLFNYRPFDLQKYIDKATQEESDRWSTRLNFVHQTYNVDGSAIDSGDALDVIECEIKQAFDYLEEKIKTLEIKLNQNVDVSTEVAKETEKDNLRNTVEEIPESLKQTDQYNYFHVYVDEKDNPQILMNNDDIPLTNMTNKSKFAGIQYQHCPCGNMNDLDYLMNKPSPCNKCGPYIPNKIRMLK